IKPFFDACSYSCRRVYGNVPPNSHVAGDTRRGLDARLARNAPVSTGAMSAPSLAIFLVLVYVTLSALSCAFLPDSVPSFITLSYPYMLLLNHCTQSPILTSHH